MKDFLRDDLKYKEMPSNPQEKDPYHHHIWNFAYFKGLDINIWPTYPDIFCPTCFLGKSMAWKYPTYLLFGHIWPKLCSFVFFWILSLEVQWNLKKWRGPEKWRCPQEWRRSQIRRRPQKGQKPKKKWPLKYKRS